MPRISVDAEGDEPPGLPPVTMDTVTRWRNDAIVKCASIVWDYLVANQQPAMLGSIDTMLGLHSEPLKARKQMHQFATHGIKNIQVREATDYDTIMKLEAPVAGDGFV